MALAESVQSADCTAHVSVLLFDYCDNSMVVANDSVLVQGSDATGTLHAVYTFTQLLQYYYRQSVAATIALAQVQ
jgi:hypothetical protein